MPTAIDLVLDRCVPRHTPDQLHGLACAVLEGEGAEHTAGVKDFTVWPLREEPAGQILRITLLPDEDCRGRPIRTPLRLGSHYFDVRRRIDTHITFAELSQSRRHSTSSLTFETPTYFSRNGRDLPLPDPVLVYGGLARRWNQYAPAELQISESARRALLDGVVICDVDIQAVSSEAAHRSRRTGFIGRVEFGLIKSGHQVAPLFSALSRAAQYLGVGAQTTRGFGVVIAGDR